MTDDIADPDGMSAIERAVQAGYAALVDGSPETVMAYARGVAHVAYTAGRKFERRPFWPRAKSADKEQS